MVILAEIKSEKGKIHMGGRKLKRRRKKIRQKGKLKSIFKKAKKYCEGTGKGREEREMRMPKAKSPADMIFCPEMTTAEESRGK